MPIKNDPPIASSRIISASDPQSMVAEEYRKLKSVIVQMSKQDQCRYSIMVSSSIGGEGKSLTSCNLAISLAEDEDHEVLLIDNDLRNPSLNKYLGIKPEWGLTDCLLDDVPVDRALIDTGRGHLTLLATGKKVPNPVEVLSSRKMDEFIAAIKERFANSFIIFDTPPALPYADARIISLLADRLLFVVKEGGTSLNNIKEALESLNNIKLLGLVYNKATTESLRGGYHYYYYDYQSKPRQLHAPEKKNKYRWLSRLLRRKGRP